MPPRYVRFEKKTSRGVLAHDVAIDGLILRQRSRRGENAKTGRVGGGRQSSTSTFRTEVAVRAAFDARVKALLAERFVQVGGPEISAAPAPRPAKKRASLARTGVRPATSEAALDAFEAAHGVRLPVGYRRFVTKHGGGTWLGFVRLHAPGPRGRVRLETLARRSPPGYLAFADTGGGDLFLWRLPSSTVHYLARGSERPRRVAADFDALVRGLTTSQRFVDRLFVGLDVDPTFVAR